MFGVSNKSFLMWNESHLKSLYDKNYLIRDQFLENGEINSICDWAKDLRNKNRLRAAGIGPNAQKNAAIRGDSICWIDMDNTPVLKPWIEKMEIFKRFLNEEAFLNIKSTQMQLAYYDTGSKGYSRHKDVSPFPKSSFEPKRTITSTLYLNKNWNPSDGGELIIYIPDEQVMNSILLTISGSKSTTNKKQNGSFFLSFGTRSSFHQFSKICNYKLVL